MFKINYKIPNKEKTKIKDLFLKDVEPVEQIEGFFEIIVNDKKYGYCPANLVSNDQEGFDLLTTWFNSLLKVLVILKSNNYVLLNDIDSYNSWLEFKRNNDDHISISVINAEKNDGIGQVVTKHIENAIYSDWQNQEVAYKEIYKEVLDSVKSYFFEIGKINKNVLNTSNFIDLKKIVSQLKLMECD